MNHWFWVCNMTSYPTLWDEWKKRGVASLGWPPKYIESNPREEERLGKNLEQARRMRRGDYIVAYLKFSRIGGIGTLERKLLPNKWTTPIVDGDHGRLAKVKWTLVPEEGHYALAPEGTVPRRMSAIYRIKDFHTFELIRKSVMDKRTWEALGDSRYLARNEKSELHPLIANNLEQLEKGLRPNPWGDLQEFSAWPVGSIDLLAVDSDGNPVAIEAKRHSCGDETVGQVCRYMAWLRRNVQSSKKVRAIIVAGEFTPQLRYAASEISNLELRRYRIPKPGEIEMLKVSPFGDQNTS